MKCRFELHFLYKSFVRMVHTQFSTPIKIFWSDSRGEYRSDNFRQFLTSKGTLTQLFHAVVLMCRMVLLSANTVMA
jgi:hypothetical protein